MALRRRKKSDTPTIEAKQEKGRHRRIVGEKLKSAAPYVVRVVIVLLAVAVCLVPALFVNNAIGYLPLLALVLTILVSFVYLQALKRSFSYSEDSLVSSCERGSEIDFVVKFKNKSPLVYTRIEPYIYISDLFDGIDTITPVSMTMMPFEDRDFSFQAQFDHIGTYSAGVKKIVINDLIGLFWFTIQNDNRHYVEVLPRLFDADHIPLTSEASTESQQPRQTMSVDDMDYAGVREYVWGDPIKTIHWKLSSRNPHGDYLTRLFETCNNPGVAIIIDTNSPDYDQDSLMFVYDGVVESALSANQHALSKGLESVLEFRSRYDEDKKIRLKDFREFKKLTDELPRIAPGPSDRAITLLKREGSSLHGQDNIVFCTSRVSEEVITLMISLKMRKRNPVLMLVVPPAMNSEEVKSYTAPLRRLDDSQIPRFVITSAADLGVQVPDEDGEADA